jgi:hypothetical protein
MWFVFLARMKGAVEASAGSGRTSTWLHRLQTVSGCERS